MGNGKDAGINYKHMWHDTKVDYISGSQIKRNWNYTTQILLPAWIIEVAHQNIHG